MFAAYLRLPDGTTQAFQSVADLTEHPPHEEAVMWMDLEQPSDDEVRAVNAVIDLDDEAWDDCLHGEQRPRIDEYENHVFLVLYGLLGPKKESDLRPRKLAVFCGARFLITVHREPLGAIQQLHTRCRQHSAHLLQNGVDHLLYYIIDTMADNCVRIAETYEACLEELEERSQNPTIDDSLLADVSRLRRDLLELRRVAASQMELIEPLSEGEYDYISESLGRQFTHVRDHFLKVLEHVDGLRELMHGVRDTYHAALAHRTNSIVRTLTIFASVLLPLSLIAGVYGMNLPLWPRPDHPATFWGVMCTMGAIAGGLLWYFRKRRWL